MAGRGSKPGERRGGRKKGQPNKLTAQVKDMITEALHEAGGVAYLKARALDTPVAFMGLVGRLIPLQANEDATKTGGVIVHIHGGLPDDGASDSPHPSA